MRRPDGADAATRAFSYHRHLAPMCGVLIALSVIELGVVHLLVAQWSRTAALVMSAISGAGLVYLVGLVRSFRTRPVVLTGDALRLNAGHAMTRVVPVDAIAHVETDFDGRMVRDPATLNMALLAWPNILLTIDPPVARRPGWKRRPPIARIALRLDDPAPFVGLLRRRLDGRALSTCPVHPQCAVPQLRPVPISTPSGTDKVT